MIVVVHVIIALLSMVWTTYGYVRPSRTSLRISYSLVALTFVSGFYLVWSEPAQMLRSCMTGLAYLGVVTIAIVATRRKLLVLQEEQA